MLDLFLCSVGMDISQTRLDVHVAGYGVINLSASVAILVGFGLGFLGTIRYQRVCPVAKCNAGF